MKVTDVLLTLFIGMIIGTIIWTFALSSDITKLSRKVGEHAERIDTVEKNLHSLFQGMRETDEIDEDVAA